MEVNMQDKVVQDNKARVQIIKCSVGTFSELITRLNQLTQFTAYFMRTNWIFTHIQKLKHN